MSIISSVAQQYELITELDASLVGGKPPVQAICPFGYDGLQSLVHTIGVAWWFFVARGADTLWWFPNWLVTFFLLFDSLIAVYPGPPTALNILLLCLQRWYVVDLSYIDVRRPCIYSAYLTV